MGKYKNQGDVIKIHQYVQDNIVINGILEVLHGLKTKKNKMLWNLREEKLKIHIWQVIHINQKLMMILKFL